MKTVVIIYLMLNLLHVVSTSVLRGSQEEEISKFQWPVPKCNKVLDDTVCQCCNPSCPVGCCCPQ